MQRFTNQFVSRCSPFLYCELDSFFASSLVDAFFVGKGKLFRYFPNPLFSLWLIADVPAILRNIEESPELKTIWEKYRKQFVYAAGIEYGQIIAVLGALVA